VRSGISLWTGIVHVIVIAMDTVLYFSFMHLEVCCTRLLISADKSLAQPGRKQATVTEDFDVHISYL
jgi:hypothetical protein